MKTVTYRDEINPGAYPRANLTLSVQGGITAATSGAQFRTIDTADGRYECDSNDALLRLIGSSRCEIILPKSSSLYEGQTIVIYLDMDADVVYQSTPIVVVTNDRSQLALLNFPRARCECVCVKVGDDSLNGWSTPYQQQLFASVNITKGALTPRGDVIPWNNIVYNTEFDGVPLWQESSNYMMIPVTGLYEFHVSYLPNNSPVAMTLALYKNGADNVAQYSFTDSNGLNRINMTATIYAVLQCSRRDVFDVRPLGDDMRSIDSEPQHYSFTCRRLA